MCRFVLCAIVIALFTPMIKSRECNGNNCSQTVTNDGIPSHCFTVLLPLLCRIGHPCCSYKDPNGNIIRGNPKRNCLSVSATCEKRGGTCLGTKDTNCRTTKVAKLCSGDSCTCCVGDHKRCSSKPKCRFQGGFCFKGNSNVFCPSKKIMREGCSGKKCSCCFTDRKCNCGKAIQSTRIVGGQKVRPKYKYPWMVGIQVQNVATDIYICGGVIINNLYVLTAAHCLFNENSTVRRPEDIFIGVADHRQNATEDDIDGITDLIGVSKIIIHENYDTGPTNDIGLLKLIEPLDISSYKQLKPVCLPTNPTKNYIGDTGLVYGWGFSGHKRITPAVLRETAVPILGPECQDKFEMIKITPQMLCAGYEEGGKDTCVGDSGGPLTVEENGRHFLVGITSYGIGCGLEDSPGIYTRVTAFLDWILENTIDAMYCN